VTSNPTIFEKAIAGSADYADAIRTLDQAGRDPVEIVQALTIADIRETARQLRPIYDLTDGADGFACLELPPKLAHDTRGSIETARQLWSALAEPNVMIKVPGTPEGVPAIEELIATGVNVNVTLLFSLASYEAVAQAYIQGLERRVNEGLPADRIASVASFFVSRLDTAIDPLLSEERLRGKAAIANSRAAYQRFKTIFWGPRWERLANHGARVQRLLWASTSTKNPAYRDVLYVEELIGAHTVNTMPPATLDAFRDHGYVRLSLEEDDGQEVLADLREAGVDLDVVTDRLLRDGVKAFGDSYDALVKAVGARREELAATR